MATFARMYPASEQAPLAVANVIGTVGLVRANKKHSPTERVRALILPSRLSGTGRLGRCQLPQYWSGRSMWNYGRAILEQ